MKEQTYFHIPTPCHENWDNMTPEGKGRFCASCSKQVVDFSLMSDQQVLNYFNNAAGKVCGRFGNDQLQRPMVEAAEQKKKVWWVAAMMPLLMLFGKVNAQKKKNTKTLGEPALVAPGNRPEIMGKVAPGIRPAVDTVAETIISTENCYRTVGDTVMSSLPERITITGTIIDNSNGSPLPFVSVMVKNSSRGIAADDKGNFTLLIKNEQTLSTLILSAIGYETKEINLNEESSSITKVLSYGAYASSLKEISINTKMISMQPALTGEVVVAVGAIVRCKKPKHIDTVKTVVNKILKKETFKIFPNPATRGQQIQLEIKKPGEYSIQLLDNNAGLILVKDFSAANDNSTIEITIPSSVVPGMYYIRIIDENKKKQYTDKLIIQ